MTFEYNQILNLKRMQEQQGIHLDKIFRLMIYFIEHLKVSKSGLF